MKVYKLQRRQCVPRPIEEAFAFFADAQNLDLLTPDWLRFRLRTPAPIVMQAGARIEYEIRWRGFPLRWLTEIEQWVPNQLFVDVQRRGPYGLWHHLHRFTSTPEGTEIEDVVRYALPLGIVGRMAHGLLVKRDVASIFEYRRKRIAELFGS